MALTLEEKNELNRAIRTYANGHIDMESFTAKELMVLLGEPYCDYATASVIAQMKDYTKQVGKRKNVNLYHFVRLVDFVSYEKNRNIISFYNEDRTVAASYDFATGKISSTLYVTYNNGNINYLFNNITRVAEWVFSYVDLLNLGYINSFLDMPSTCPKGYIKYLKNKNLKISHSSLSAFRDFEKYGIDDNEMVIDILKRCNGCDVEELAIANIKGITYALDHEYLDDFFSDESTWGRSRQNKQIDLIVDYLKLCNRIKQTPEWKNLLKNYAIVKRLDRIERHKASDKSVAEWQKKVNLAFENDTFEVIVPTSYAEFQAEANYQNNCVCSYYYPKVAEEQTRIVFIRRKSNRNTPYITCEVSRNGNIVQYLTRFNNRVADGDAIAFRNEYREYLNSVFSSIAENKKRGGSHAFLCAICTKRLDGQFADAFSCELTEFCQVVMFNKFSFHFLYNLYVANFLILML